MWEILIFKIWFRLCLYFKINVYNSQFVVAQEKCPMYQWPLNACVTQNLLCNSVMFRVIHYQGPIIIHNMRFFLPIVGQVKSLMYCWPLQLGVTQNLFTSSLTHFMFRVIHVRGQWNIQGFSYTQQRIDIYKYMQ